MKKPEYISMNVLTHMMSYYGDKYNKNCDSVEEFEFLTHILTVLQKEYINRQDTGEWRLTYDDLKTMKGEDFERFESVL